MTLGKRENIGAHELRERFAIEHDCTYIVMSIYTVSTQSGNGIEVRTPDQDPELWACIGRVWACVVEHGSHKKYICNKEDIAYKYNTVDAILSLLRALVYPIIQSTTPCTNEKNSNRKEGSMMDDNQTIIIVVD